MYSPQRAIMLLCSRRTPPSCRRLLRDSRQQRLLVTPSFLYTIFCCARCGWPVRGGGGETPKQNERYENECIWELCCALSMQTHLTPSRSFSPMQKRLLRLFRHIVRPLSLLGGRSLVLSFLAALITRWQSLKLGKFSGV